MPENIYNDTQHFHKRAMVCKHLFLLRERVNAE